MDKVEFTNKLKSLFGKPSNKTIDQYNNFTIEVVDLAGLYDEDTLLRAYQNLRDTHKGMFPLCSVIKVALTGAVVVKEAPPELTMSIKRVFGTEVGRHALDGGYSKDFYLQCEVQGKILTSCEGDELFARCLKARKYYRDHCARIKKSSVLGSLKFDFENRERLFYDKVKRIMGAVK